MLPYVAVCCCKYRWKFADVRSAAADLPGELGTICPGSWSSARGLFMWTPAVEPCFQFLAYPSCDCEQGYDCRAKGPCGDCPLQRPPGFQHAPTWDPAKVVFLLSSREYVFDCFRAKDLANDLNMRPPRKINVGFAQDSRTYCFYSKGIAVCR